MYVVRVAIRCALYLLCNRYLRKGNIKEAQDSLKVRCVLCCCVVCSVVCCCIVLCCVVLCCVVLCCVVLDLCVVCCASLYWMILSCVLCVVCCVLCVACCMLCYGYVGVLDVLDVLDLSSRRMHATYVFKGKWSHLSSPHRQRITATGTQQHNHNKTITQQKP